MFYHQQISQTRNIYYNYETIKKTNSTPNKLITYEVLKGCNIQNNDDMLGKYFKKSKNNKFYQNSEHSELSITYQQFKNGTSSVNSSIQQSRPKKDNQGININLNQSLEKIRQDLNRKYGKKNNSNFGPIVNNNNFIPPKASQEDFDPQPESDNDGFFNKVVNFFKSCVNCSTVPSITTVPPVMSSIPYVNNLQLKDEIQERQTITYKGFKTYNNKKQLPTIYENNTGIFSIDEDDEVCKILRKRRNSKGCWVSNGG